jgi:starch phosphorylase
MCVFTTHTPVAAGHDQFPLDLAGRVLGQHEALNLHDVFCCGDTLNMTYLALNLSHYVNGVAKRHGEVSRHMFSSYVIDSITNGVHPATWTCGGFQALFDKYIRGWRDDSFSLRYALSIPRSEIWQAHMHAKQELLRYVNRQSNIGMDVGTSSPLAWRGASRPTSVRTCCLPTWRGSGRSTPRSDRYRSYTPGRPIRRDQPGKDLIAGIVGAMESLRGTIKAIFLPNYDMELGRMITAGVDVWLNTPQPPLEASGTSGMKAALNGVPSLSILDGWWIEGCIEGVTGWAIGSDGRATGATDRTVDAGHLYDKMRDVVLPTYYRDRDRYCTVMAHAIALNGSFFNTQRMIQQYVLKAYFS